MLSKNVKTKKCAPKLVLFNEKKMRKIWLIFYIENWLLKSNFVTFWHLPLHQFSKFNNFHWVCWFLAKNLSNFVPPAWKLDNLYYHTLDNSFFNSTQKHKRGYQKVTHGKRNHKISCQISILNRFVSL